MPGSIDESRPFIPVRIAALTVPDTRSEACQRKPPVARRGAWTPIASSAVCPAGDADKPEIGVGLTHQLKAQRHAVDCHPWQ